MTLLKWLRNRLEKRMEDNLNTRLALTEQIMKRMDQTVLRSRTNKQPPLFRTDYLE